MRRRSRIAVPGLLREGDLSAPGLKWADIEDHRPVCEAAAQHAGSGKGAANPPDREEANHGERDDASNPKPDDAFVEGNHAGGDQRRGGAWARGTGGLRGAGEIS